MQFILFAKYVGHLGNIFIIIIAISVEQLIAYFFSSRITLKIEYSAQDDIREEIFSLFASSGMPILSMEETIVGLCDIYSKLCDIEDERGGEEK